jgi:hypothetical protein
MKRLFVLAAIVALVLPATALGKGPSAASIDGPGSSGGINISGDGESGGTPLGDLTQQAGFFPAAFGQEPDPMLADAPKGSLGPKYTINYTVPGPNNDTFHIKQDVYPYATPNPVTYMEPGQKIFDMETRGGWFQSDSMLKEMLVTAGLPKIAPSGSSSADDGVLSTGLTSALVGALLLAAAGWILMRRRTRPAPAA